MPKCYQSRVINAPINKVWEKIRDFHDVSWAPNAVDSCEKVGLMHGNEAGAKRILNGAFHESLLSIDENNFHFSYSIDEGISPVSSKEVKNYVGNVRLFSITQTDETFMEWESSWESKSKDAEEFCHTIYVSLMNDLNRTMELETSS